MKKISMLSLMAAIAGSLFCDSAPAAPAVVSGFYFVTINGFLREPITQNGQVNCTGYLYVVPSTVSNPNIASIGAAVLANSATANASATAVFQPNKQNFTCEITVPYYFNAFDSATQSLYLVYNVKLNDPGFVNVQVNPPQVVPGTGVRSTRQPALITAPPGGGQGLGPFVVYL